MNDLKGTSLATKAYSQSVNSKNRSSDVTILNAVRPLSKDHSGKK